MLRKMESGMLGMSGFRSSFRDWAAECTETPEGSLLRPVSGGTVPVPA